MRTVALASRRLRWRQHPAAEGRIVDGDWNRYDTRHVVYRPLGMTPDELEVGYWRADRDYYERTLDAFGGARSKVRPDPPTEPHADGTETRERQLVVR